VTTLPADAVRIPKSAREALARHEVVVVMNRERPAFVLVNPEDHARPMEGRGRPARDAMALLMALPPADPEFVADMEAVLESAGDVPESPWERF